MYPPTFSVYFLGILVYLWGRCFFGLVWGFGTLCFLLGRCFSVLAWAPPAPGFLQREQINNVERTPREMVRSRILGLGLDEFRAPSFCLVLFAVVLVGWPCLGLVEFRISRAWLKCFWPTCVSIPKTRNPSEFWLLAWLASFLACLLATNGHHSLGRNGMDCFVVSRGEMGPGSWQNLCWFQNPGTSINRIASLISMQPMSHLILNVRHWNLGKPYSPW